MDKLLNEYADILSTLFISNRDNLTPEIMEILISIIGRAVIEAKSYEVLKLVLPEDVTVLDSIEKFKDLCNEIIKSIKSEELTKELAKLDKENASKAIGSIALYALRTTEVLDRLSKLSERVKVWRSEFPQG